MSVAAKTHLIDVVIGNTSLQRFKIPEQAINGLLVFFKDYRVDSKEDFIDAEVALDSLHKQSSKPAVKLRGFRQRDGLTQVELANKLKTTQSVIASMEKAKRPISYKMAQKLAKIFDTSPEVFLDSLK